MMLVYMQMLEYMPCCLMLVDYFCIVVFPRSDLWGLSRIYSLGNHSFLYMLCSRMYSLYYAYTRVFSSGLRDLSILPQTSFIEMLYTHYIHQGVQHDHRCKRVKETTVGGQSNAEYVLIQETL